MIPIYNYACIMLVLLMPPYFPTLHATYKYLVVVRDYFLHTLYNRCNIDQILSCEFSSWCEVSCEPDVSFHHDVRVNCRMSHVVYLTITQKSPKKLFYISVKYYLLWLLGWTKNCKKVNLKSLKNTVTSMHNNNCTSHTVHGTYITGNNYWRINW